MDPLAVLVSLLRSAGWLAVPRVQRTPAVVTLLGAPKQLGLYTPMHGGTAPCATSEPAPFAPHTAAVVLDPGTHGCFDLVVLLALHAKGADSKRAVEACLRKKLVEGAATPAWLTRALAGHQVRYPSQRS